MSELDVVICGTGIAGAEGALRLRRLAGDRCRMTIVDPAEEFGYRPLAVREPFATGHVRRYPIARLADDLDARHIQDAVAGVDLEQRTLQTAAGLELPYDAVLLALGGRQLAPVEHAHVFTDHNAGETFHGIVQDIEGGYVTSIVLLEPQEPTWPLPLYELALMTAERASSMGMAPQITLCTPHERPLHGFGDAASDAVQRLLEEAAITVHTRRAGARRGAAPRDRRAGRPGAAARADRHAAGDHRAARERASLRRPVWLRADRRPLPRARRRRAGVRRR